MQAKQGRPGVAGITVAVLSDDVTQHGPALREPRRHGTDVPPPVKRVAIPKPAGGVRPLGMPVVEDKRVQLAVTRLLTAIYAQDVLRGSYGYRPHGGALDAVDALTIKRQCGQDNWGGEADISGFFDSAS